VTKGHSEMRRRQRDKDGRTDGLGATLIATSRVSRIMNCASL